MNVNRAKEDIEKSIKFVNRIEVSESVYDEYAVGDFFVGGQEHEKD